MKLFNHRSEAGHHVGFGVVHDGIHYDMTQWLTLKGYGQVVDLVSLVGDRQDSVMFESRLLSAIGSGEEGLCPLSGTIRFAPVVRNPEKILCIGLNYKSHSEECQMEIPQNPVVFSKFNNALAAHEDRIVIPEGVIQMDHEVELVVIIGKEAKHVSKADADAHIAGYTIGNDISARDLQFKTPQWLLGKTCDGFAPIGPYMVLNHGKNGFDSSDVELSCRVNGDLRQCARTSDMIFDVPTLISYLSHHMTLKPGDLIFTGTPSGVILGHKEDDRYWLEHEDVMELTIEGIGTLTNILI